MTCHLLALYVTVEQESAIRELFCAKGWAFHPEDLSLDAVRPRCSDTTDPEGTSSHEPAVSSVVSHFEVQVVQSVSDSDNETMGYDGDELLSSLIDASQSVENDDSVNGKREAMVNKDDVMARSLEYDGVKTNGLLADMRRSYVGNVQNKSPNAGVAGDSQSVLHENKNLTENWYSVDNNKSTQDIVSLLEDIRHKGKVNYDKLDLKRKIQLSTIKEFDVFEDDMFENAGIKTKQMERKTHPAKHSFNGDKQKTGLLANENDGLSTQQHKNMTSSVKRILRSNTAVAKDIKEEELEKISDQEGEKTIIDDEVMKIVNDVIESVRVYQKVNGNVKPKAGKDSVMAEKACAETLIDSKKEGQKHKQLKRRRQKVIIDGKISNKETASHSTDLKSSEKNDDIITVGGNAQVKKTKNSNDERPDDEVDENVTKNSDYKMKKPTIEEFKKMFPAWEAMQENDPQRKFDTVLFGPNLRPTDKPTDLDSNFYSAANQGWFCLNCSLLFKNLNFFLRHRFETDGRCFYQCDLCNKKYTVRSDMVMHRKYHDKNFRPFVCPHCNNSYRRRTILNNHIKQNHLDQNSYMCVECGKEFKIRPCLLQHLRYAHIKDSERTALCSHCPKRFKNLSDLNAHLQTHTSELLWSCDICKKEFKTRKYMREHRKIHFAERDHICDVCGKGFFKFEHLRNHKKLHTGEKPFSCTVCSYRCTVKCNLDKHMKTHKNVKETKTSLKAQRKSESKNQDNFMEFPFKNEVQGQSCFTELEPAKSEANNRNVKEPKNESYSVAETNIDSNAHTFTSLLQAGYGHQIDLTTLNSQS